MIEDNCFAGIKTLSKNAGWTGSSSGSEMNLKEWHDAAARSENQGRLRSKIQEASKS
jgi:hypothetical protein